MKMRLVGVLLSALVASTAAEANEYPSRPVTVVVPYAAGGPTDIVGRLISEALSTEMGARFIVENVVGAGGTLATARVASAGPDGYTLLFNHIGMATALGFYPKAPADPRRDFEPIGQIGDVPMTLVARKNFPPTDAASLMAFVKAGRDKITYAHAGPGTASHLCGLLLAKAAGFAPTTVPYKGTGPAMTDLLGGQIDFMCDQTTNTTGAINDGSIKAYAITAAERLGTLPQVPTMAEAGVRDFELSIWHGLYAPKGTPKAVIDRLTVALQAALHNKLVLERFAQLGLTPANKEAATPAGLANKLNSEVERWTPVIQESLAK
jgi:tripartite-type tricarboxylate transporter receptor subunit TctC